MAIRVICPGCMTSFEVDDRFAGKKGPCPKCGHIIEIPKIQVVVHAPDEAVVNGKRQKVLGHDARPIEQKRFTFTGGQTALGICAALGFFALTYVVGLAHNGWVSLIVGALLGFAIAFPIADVGYMLIRDENDLEMQEGPERRRNALFTALVFGGSWLIFEAFIFFLGGTGVLACLFLIPCAAVGAFGAVIFFDCNFGRALLVYLIFMFAAIIGRGLIVEKGWTPNGWIWQENRRSLTQNQQPAPTPTPAPVPKTPTESATPDATPASPPQEPTPAAAPKDGKKPALSREAPKVDPTKRRR